MSMNSSFGYLFFIGIIFTFTENARVTDKTFNRESMFWAHVLQLIQEMFQRTSIKENENYTVTSNHWGSSLLSENWEMEKAD